MSKLPFSAIAEVNPSVRIPKGLSGNDAVSFIPMGDVSESGYWMFKQVRQLRSVTTGFTAFEEGDLLVAKITPCLENGKGAHAVGLENRIGFGSTEFHVLRARPGNAQRFVFHLTQWRKFRQAAEGQMVGSAGQQRVPRSFFDEFLVDNFDHDEQSALALIFDTLDTAIHETEAIIAKLKAVKQGLLHDLLTRGIDANGELRPPQAEAPQLYKQSPLGWIPKEWEAVTLSACSLKIADRDHTTPLYIEDGVLIVSPTNLQGDEGIDFVSSKRISRRAHEINCKKTDLAPGDIILHRIGAGLGRVRLVTADMPEFSILHSMAQIRPNLNEMTSHFMLWAMRIDSTKNQMGLGTQSIGVPDLGLDKISNFIVPKPPLEEQRQIASRLVALQARIDADSNDCAKLAALKSGLTDDLLTGSVRVTPLLAEAAQQTGSA